MKTCRKITALVLTLLMGLSLAACKKAEVPQPVQTAAAETPASGYGTAPIAPVETVAAALKTPEGETAEAVKQEPQTEEKKNTAVILYTNDVHTYINKMVKDADGKEKKGLSYASVAAMKKDLAAQGENVLLVDAGDHVQGTAFGALDEGRGIINIMNATGYDLATLGNHEFDYGMLRTFSFVSKAAFPYVSCNFYDTFDGDLLLQPYYIFNIDGKKIAFVGITTPESQTKAAPVYFMDEEGNYKYRFYGAPGTDDLYTVIQMSVDAAREEGADYVIALAHTGIDPSSVPYRSTDIIPKVKGIDAWIDGHSHNLVEGLMVKDAEGKDVILTQTGTAFRGIGKMVIDADGKITTEVVTEYPDRDETVEAMEEMQINYVNDTLGVKVAVSPKGFWINDPDSGERLVRNRETNMGDLATDAVYYYANRVRGIDCDIAISNGGGLRADIPAGEVTYESCKTTQPFGNIMCAVKVNGQTVLDCLEWCTRDIGLKKDDGSPAEMGSFMQVAGLSYTIDTTVPNTTMGTETGEWKSGPAGEYRVKDVKVYDKKTGTWEPLDLNREYTVAGNNYMLRNGGDGLAMFKDSEAVEDNMGEDYMIFARYMKDFEKNENGDPELVSAKSPLKDLSGYLMNYETIGGSGRITVIR